MDEGVSGGHVPSYCVVYCDEWCMQEFFEWGFVISMVFSLLTGLVSFYNIAMHFINFNNPYFQAKIVIILLMPPIYCLTSTLSFLSYHYASYITLIRDFYEVVGLFAFFYLMLAFIAFDHDTNQLNQKRAYQLMCESSKEVPHDCPYNYCQKPFQFSSWHKAKFFTARCKRAILQYIIVKIVTSIILGLLYPNFEIRTRDYTDWDFVIYNKINTYIYWFTSVSSYIAFYYMSLYFSAVQNQLRPFHPDLKFTTFNLTMFFTYWQKVWMMFFQNRILACFDHQGHIYNYKKVMYNLENLMICFEMFFMALAGMQAYNFQDYVVLSLRNKFGSIMYVLTDILNMFKAELRLIKPKKFGFIAEHDQAETELMTINSLKRKDSRCQRKKNAVFEDQIINDYF